MEAMKKTVRVTIEKEIEIELTPDVFGSLTIEEYLDEFSTILWPVNSIDEVFKYAAGMIAVAGEGSYDMLGPVGRQDTENNGESWVKFKIVYEDREMEIVSPT